MLKSWKLQNFKSIQNGENLSLAPVTVLTGLNSSGKSSLLQSILMIAQTFNSHMKDRVLLPNGSFVQLGSFNDIVHKGDQNLSITVEFELNFTQELEKEAQEKQKNQNIQKNEYYIDDDIYDLEDRGVKAERVHVAVSFRNEMNASHSLAYNVTSIVLDTLSLAITPTIIIEKDDYKYGSFTIDLSRLTEDQFTSLIKHVTARSLRLVTPSLDQAHYKAILSHKDDKKPASYRVMHISEDVGVPPSYGPCIATLTHFFPGQLFRKFHVITTQQIRYKNLLFYLNSLARHEEANVEIPEKLLPDTEEVDWTLPEDLPYLIQTRFPEEYEKVGFTYTQANDMFFWFLDIQKAFDKERSEDIHKKLLNIILQEYPHLIGETNQFAEGLEVNRNHLSLLNMDHAMEQVTETFVRKIRYLGPLRNDPQAPQRFFLGNEMGDVGSTGEYAATVYDSNRETYVKWYHPIEHQVVEGPLQDALQAWIIYLHVAQGIQVAEAGHSGFGWQVLHPSSPYPLPLSAVGVGVSQILPLLVMGLLSPEQTILLIEQPELHLHPRIQARLGDFFVGLAHCQKQCIIETHSENLINQLRYHIVQAQSQEDTDLCQIYFVDQNGEGQTHFTPIKISPHGNILNWPDGFFDESQLQEDHITRAGLQKKSGENKK